MMTEWEIAMLLHAHETVIQARDIIEKYPDLKEFITHAVHCAQAIVRLITTIDDVRESAESN